MSAMFNASEVFEIGIQIEKSGNMFYTVASQVTNDISLKRMFMKLADWEGSHVELFESLKNALPDSSKSQDIFDPENQIHLYMKAMADSQIFNYDPQSVIESCETSAEILEKAITFEKESVVYYTSMKEIVGEDLGKSQIDQLIHEELGHIGYLTSELQLIQ